MMRKLILTSFLLLTCTPLLNGCWDRVEVNDIAIVLASAIDKEPDGRVRWSVQLPLPGNIGGPSGGGGHGSSGSKPSYVDSAVGRTVREAGASLQKRTSRRFFLAHRRVLLVSEEYAHDPGLSNIFDTMPRLPESRLSTYLIITKGKAYDLLNAEPHFERFSSEAMRELAKAPNGIEIKMKDVAAAMSFPGSDPLVPYMTRKESEKGKQTKKEIEFTGYALFQKDKMAVIASKDNIQGLMWLRGRIRSYMDTITIDKNHFVSYTLKEGSTDIRVQLANGKPKFTIICRGNAILQENQTDLDLSRLPNAAEAEKVMNEQIKSNIVKTLELFKQQKVDPAALGNKLWQSYPHKWETTYRSDWHNHLAEAEFDVQVDTHFSNYGIIFENIVKEEPK